MTEIFPAPFYFHYVYIFIRSNITMIYTIGGMFMNQKEHPLYFRWKSIMDRCYDTNRSNYKYYGARNVTVCNRWHDFWNFVDDIDNHMENGHLLYEKGYQLDKDINGGNIYSLDNCIVISARENRRIAYEKQQRKIIAYNDNEAIEFQSISEASRKLGIPRNTIQLNLKKDRVHSSGYRFEYCN